MTRRQAATFFFGATGVFLLVFLVLTVDSHRRFPALTGSERLTPEVLAGKDTWHYKNCINCHTLLGEGAYYAPDLTRITSQRGAAYLAQFLQDPARFYSEEQDRRLMTNPRLSEAEIGNVIAFLDWIDGIQNADWPPRPILVSGGGLAVTGGAAAAGPASDDPVELGEALFRASPPACFTCHSTTPGVQLAGPSLASLATRAEALVGTPRYAGAARDAAGYIEESILQPNAYLVPGELYSAAGRSLMLDNYGETLAAEQVAQLVAYLLTLR